MYIGGTMKYINKLIYFFQNMFPFKQDTLHDKIVYLLKRNISVYDRRDNRSNHLFTNKNILIAIEELRSILDQDIHYRYINEINLQMRTMHYIPIIAWYSDDQHMLSDDKKVFKVWLELVSKLNDIYLEGITQVDSGKLYINSLKLKNYLKHIDVFMDSILVE